MSCCRICLFILALFCIFTLPSYASNNTPSIGLTTLPPGSKPIDVKVGLRINDIIQVNEKNETVGFQGTIKIQWHDPRLAFKATPHLKIKRFTDSAAKQKLDGIWKPQLYILSLRGQRKVEQLLLTISPNGEVSYRERFYALVETHMDLREFPFDHQSLKIAIQPYSYRSSQVRLTPLKIWQNLAKTAPLQEWKIESIKAHVKEVVGPFYNRLHSRYTLVIHYDRKPVYYVVQVMLPIIFIVLLAFSVFWVTHSSIANRLAISLSAVLTVVVFQWRVYGDLPHISYLTYLDIFMLYSLITAGLTIIASVFIEQIQQSRQNTLIRLCKIGFPIFYFIGIVLFSLIIL